MDAVSRSSGSSVNGLGQPTSTYVGRRSKKDIKNSSDSGGNTEAQYGRTGQLAVVATASASAASDPLSDGRPNIGQRINILV